MYVSTCVFFFTAIEKKVGLGNSSVLFLDYRMVFINILYIYTLNLSKTEECM